MGFRTITPGELAGLGRVDLIDVRTPAEFAEMHVEGATLAPLDRLDPAALQASRGDRAGAPMYVLCRSGGRARKACEAFDAAGLGAAVVLVEGGTLACEQAGLRMVRGKKTIALERQVRIAAGSLVVIGTALGAVVHPGFLALAAFVGAGLVFSGVTDTCGMAMLLARMPWNQGGGTTATTPGPATVGPGASR